MTVIQIKGRIVPLTDNLIKAIESMTEAEKSQTRKSLECKSGGQMFSAKSMLTRMTLDSLTQDHKRAVEDEPRYLGQMLEPVAFVHSVGDRLCLMPHFSGGVIQASLISVAEAYEQLLVEVHTEFQNSFSWRSWQREGVRVQ